MICPECGFDDEGIIGRTLEKTDKNRMTKVELNENGKKMLRHQAHELERSARNIELVAKNLKRIPTDEEVRLN